MKRNEFLDRIYADEAKYGEIGKIPDDEIDKIQRLSPGFNEWGTSDAEMTRKEQEALEYMVRRGDFTTNNMMQVLKRSRSWVNRRVRRIRRELEKEK